MGQTTSRPAHVVDPVEQVIASFTASSDAPDNDAASTEPHVFISHAGEQKMSIVDVLRARLKEKHPGMDVFVDEWSLKGGDMPMARIGAACMRATVGVVLLSPEFVRKKYCMAELRVLLQRCGGQRAASNCQPQDQGGQPGDQQWPKVQLLPVLYGLTVEDINTVRALYDSQTWCGGEPKPPAQVLDAWAADVGATADFTMIRDDQWRGHSELADLVVGRVAELLEAAGKLPGAVSTLMVRSTVTEPEKVELVGRQQELEQALEALTEGRYVEVIGGPGEGKSSLVQHVVARVCEAWSQQPAFETGGQVAFALEVDLSLQGLQKDGLRDGKDLKDVVAAKLLGQVQEAPPQEQWRVLQDWLRKQAPAPVLVTFENAEECVALPAEGGMASKSMGEAFQEVLELLSRMDHVYLVVATRARTPGLQKSLPAGSTVVLAQLSGCDGLQLIEARLGAGYQWSTDGKDRAAAEQLVQLVQSNPLTLVVAAGLVRRVRRTLQDVLLRAKQGIANIAASRLDRGMQPYMAALSRWLCDFLDEPEQQLLGAVCVYPGSFTAPAAAAVAPATNQSTVDDTLQLLADMSLLRQRTVTAISDLQPDMVDVRYSMHALVRDAASGTLNPAATATGLHLLARWALLADDGPGQLLLRCAPAGAEPDVARRSYLLREDLQTFAAAGTGLEVSEVTGAADGVPEVQELLVGAANNVGLVLRGCGHMHAAKQLQQNVGEAAAKVLGAEHPVTLATRHNLADTLQAMGELGGARQLQKDMLGIFTRVLGPEHPGTLLVKHSLAITLRGMGELGYARQLKEEVLRARTHHLGEEHPDTLGSKHDLAITLRDMGELAGARRLQEEVLEVYTGLLGGTHPDTLHTKQNLAETLLVLGELGGARGLLQEVLEVHTYLLGGEHPGVLRTKHTLANTLRAMGELGAARQMQEEVLQARTCLLGGEHPDTVNTKHELASTLRAMGELSGARQLQEEVLEVRTQLLGAAHPDTLSTKHNLANTMRDMGDLVGAKGAQEEVLQAFTRLLGTDHPETLRIKHNLTITLRAMGELGAARQRLEEVLEARVCLLGEKHLDTLYSKHNLAITLRALGELDGARQLLEEVLEGHVEVHALEHPDRLNAMACLATTLSEMGEHGRAKQVKGELLEHHMRTKGPEHAASLGAMNSLAYTLWRLGELKDAHKMAEEAVAGHQRVLGPEHTDTMNAKETLGVILREMGEVAEARRLQGEALAVLEPLWGADDVTVLDMKHDLGLTLLACGDVAGTKQLWETVLEARTRVLGAGHPDTLVTKHALAGLGQL